MFLKSVTAAEENSINVNFKRKVSHRQKCGSLQSSSSTGRPSLAPEQCSSEDQFAVLYCIMTMKLNLKWKPMFCSWDFRSPFGMEDQQQSLIINVLTTQFING